MFTRLPQPVNDHALLSYYIHHHAKGMCKGEWQWRHVTAFGVRKVGLIWLLVFEGHMYRVVLSHKVWFS